MKNKNLNQTNKKEYFSSEMALRKMTTKIPFVDKSKNVGEIKSYLFKNSDKFETINYIYVVDKTNKLKGVISIKDIFRLSRTKKASKIMKKRLITACPHTDQERVALLAIKHNLKAIPVIDKQKKFLGVVPSDTILNILHDEDIEDALHFAGVHEFDDSALNIIKAPARVHFKKRIPWLILGLFGGVVAAFIVGFFEEALKAQLILAAFIPAVVYMADAVGTQVQIIFVRSLALDHKIDLRKYILREVKVSFSLAALLGVMIFAISFLFLNNFLLGIILAASIFVTVIVATGVAIFLPWIFQKYNYDPAIASGPFATVIRDILSLLIYFSIAQTMIKFFA